MTEQSVTLAITLPLGGTAHDYAEAISYAMALHGGNGMAVAVLSVLLGLIQVPRPMNYIEGRSELVFGKMP